MTPAQSVRLQTRAVSVPVSRAALLICLCALLGTFAHTGYAQTYNQGLPAIGNNSVPSTAAPSKMIIDATMFPDTDMCASIADACTKLTATVGAAYPFGATIDARGFTGNQVCSSGNITTMMKTCSFSDLSTCKAVTMAGERQVPS